MRSETNPQGEEMASEAMVRTLSAQAIALWPQELPLYQRYGQPGRIVDVGCGTGEISARLADRYPQASLTGYDLDAAHLVRARERCPTGEFLVADAFALPLEDASVDLTVCRHLIQAVPRPQDLLAELVRVTVSGGWVHVVAEDYAMIHFHPVPRDADAFWKAGPIPFCRKIGTDLEVGRKVVTFAYDLGLLDIRLDYVVVDTLRVDRAVFVAIWEAWRDAYAESLARETDLELPDVLQWWDEMLTCLHDPRGYGVWQVPVLSARVP